MKNHFLIIDGRNLLWRCSDAFKDLSVAIDGREISTGGMYGFLSILLSIHERYGGRPIVAWEGKNNFRFKLYPKYKDKGEIDPDRQEFIEELREQEKRLKSILRAVGVRQYSGLRCEADDVIGTLSRRIKQNTIIYSADSDLRQLVTSKVRVVAPGYRGSGEKIYDFKAVLDKHGVEPTLISDLKALSGDSSDNIPGIRGIGEKTAAKLINAYGSVDMVVKAAKLFVRDSSSVLNWPVAPRFADSITENAKELRLYKKLTTIRTKVVLKPIKRKVNRDTLARQLRVYRFFSLIEGSDLWKLGRI